MIVAVNSYIFVNSVEIYKLKAKYSEVNAAPLCLGNVSKDYVYDSSVDYDSIDVDDIVDIHKYLILICMQYFCNFTA